MRGQIYPGFQVVTSMLRGFMVRRVGETISWHICKKSYLLNWRLVFCFVVFWITAVVLRIKTL